MKAQGPPYGKRQEYPPMLQNLQPQNLRTLQELLLEVVVFGFDPRWYQQQQKQHQTHSEFYLILRLPVK